MVSIPLDMIHPQTVSHIQRAEKVAMILIAKLPAQVLKLSSWLLLSQKAGIFPWIPWCRYLKNEFVVYLPAKLQYLGKVLENYSETGR